MENAKFQKIYYYLKLIWKLQNPLFLCIMMEFFWRYKRGGAYTGLVIFHPKSTFIQARPGWIYDSQYKEVEIFIPDRLTGSTQMILAKAEVDIL